jgi:hypothetical protein
MEIEMKITFNAVLFVFVMLLIFPMFLMAQSPVEFPWESLGVNMTIIGVIVGFVQVLKMTVLKNLPGIAYIAVTVVISAVAAFFTTQTGTEPIIYLQNVLSWASAAAFTFDITARAGLKSLFGAFNKGDAGQ